VKTRKSSNAMPLPREERRRKKNSSNVKSLMKRGTKAGEKKESKTSVNRSGRYRLRRTTTATIFINSSKRRGVFFGFYDFTRLDELLARLDCQTQIRGARMLFLFYVVVEAKAGEREANARNQLHVSR
jgi:hypothetical protein